jgi:hypothetical protein
MMEESFIKTFSDVLSFPLIALTIQSDLSFVTKKSNYKKSLGIYPTSFNVINNIAFWRILHFLVLN